MPQKRHARRMRLNYIIGLLSFCREVFDKKLWLSASLPREPPRVGEGDSCSTAQVAEWDVSEGESSHALISSAERRGDSLADEAALEPLLSICGLINESPSHSQP